MIVDDGSTDATAGIAEEYGFRVIRTPNRGLSSARNTGLEAATGDIVAYIDDDARPDLHWLHYVADTFLTTDYVGVGGPNVLPAQSGPVSWCVENAPGGPIHVLLNDREAEHIPGCNMAFRKSALLAVGGFDPRYRIAGDDVDICWKMQARGWKLGFNPAAVVWHHRRNAVRAYWRQQVGYGRAEALLEKKWPEKYNAAGHLTWAGRLYGGGLAQTLGRASGRIYNGVWGSAPFQSVYGAPASGLLALPTMPEWYALVGLLALLSALGIFWAPLLLVLPLLLVAIGAPVAQAVLGGARARFPFNMPRGNSLRLRGLTFLLHLMQPLARLLGRSANGLTPFRMRGPSGGDGEFGMRNDDEQSSIPHSEFPIPHSVHSPFSIHKMAVWRESWQSSQDWLEGIEMEIKEHGGAYREGATSIVGTSRPEVGMLGSARLRMGIEEHGQGRQMARFRIWPRVEAGGICSLLFFFGLTVGAGMSSAPVAAFCLGTLTLLLAGRIVYECSIGMGTLALGVRAAPGVQLEGSGKSLRPRPYGLLFAYAAPMWKSWLFILLLTLLSTAFSLLQPWPLKVLVDNVLGGQALGGLAMQVAAFLPGATGPAGLLLWVALGGLVVYLGASGLECAAHIQLDGHGAGDGLPPGARFVRPDTKALPPFPQPKFGWRLARARHDRRLGGAHCRR